MEDKIKAMEAQMADMAKKFDPPVVTAEMVVLARKELGIMSGLSIVCPSEGRVRAALEAALGIATE